MHMPRTCVLFGTCATLIVSACLHLLAPRRIDTTYHLPNYSQREEDAARALGVELTNWTHAAQAYILCLHCQQAAVHTAPPKIVALVEVRNVAHSLDSFLTDLEQVVDGIVALDDHSDDATRAILLERCLGQCKLDALVVKTGRWTRQELLDRQLLLEAARRMGGTHFVLLDYDERFGADCVSSGALVNSIRGLKPGHSLFVPWVELWKHPSVHRVLPKDKATNFLVRRQTVVFADPFDFSYTAHSSSAHSLGGNDASIHALRCPRSVCPRPPRYSGPGTPLTASDPRVHQAPPNCVIIESRFMHAANVLMKSAWYEALGRVLGAASSATRGKMLDILFPSTTKSIDTSVALVRSSPSWFNPHSVQSILKQRQIERWRAKELVTWFGQLGDAQFNNLSSVDTLDSAALRFADANVRLRPEQPWLHVPRLKRGTFVVAVDNSNTQVMNQVVKQFAVLVDIDLKQSVTRVTEMHAETSNREDNEEDDDTLRYEHLCSTVLDKLNASISASASQVAYTTISDMSSSELNIVSNFLSAELAQFDVIFLVPVDRTGVDEDLYDRYRHVVTLCKSPGSHLRFVAFDIQALGSVSTLAWLRQRITGEKVRNETEQVELLGLAEKVHAQLRITHQGQVVPVARLVFSLNTGRSGSKYVAELLQTSDNAVYAVHEPRCPEGLCSGGGAMRMQNVSLEDTYEERRRIKVTMINAAISSMAKAGLVEMDNGLHNGAECEATIQSTENERNDDDGMVWEVSSVSGCRRGVVKPVVYAETNPNFKSWFYDVTLDHYPARGYQVSVLVLRKYHAAVLKSLYETGYFTSRNGYNWMETGNGVNAKVRSIDKDAELDAFDKIMSYLINAEAVTRSVMQKYNSTVTFIEERSENIYHAQGAFALLDQLGLRSGVSTLNVAGVRQDKYGVGERKKRNIETSLEECQHRVNAYVEKCAKVGIALPNMPQLHPYGHFEYN